MNSPFPGMDPYLESPSIWEELHHVFLTECMYQLVNALPPGYVARIGERVGVIGVTDEAASQYVPDVALARMRTDRDASPAAHGAVAVAEPLTMTDIEDLEVRQGYIEILRLPENELVTAIELLSPWNKFGEGIGQYHAKRRGLVGRGVHVVEIDLLRRGARTALAEPLPPADYCVMVFLGDRRPQVLVHAWRLRDALPTISVPLRRPDPNTPLVLSDLLHQAYDRGRFDRKVQYAKSPPPPPLSADDAAWASSLLRAT